MDDSSQLIPAPGGLGNTASRPHKLRQATRARDFQVSPWSVPADLHGRHSAPISLSSGAPAENLIPVDRLREAAVRVWNEPNQWGYGGTNGYHPLRDWLTGWLGTRGTQSDPEEIVITTGSQQGLDLVARTYLDEGDAVIVEGPTYIGALQVFDSYGATYVVAPMDADGLDTDRLAELLAERRSRGEAAPKLLYTVPTFQNPTGRLMSEERRDAMLNLARQHGIIVVEDDPYGELFFHAAPPRSLRARDADVIALGTFSKTLAPAVRVGWMVLPADLADVMSHAREVNDVQGDRMSQRIVTYAVNGFLDEHVAWLREQYRRRSQTLADALEEYLPAGVRIDRPEGGFFQWVDLPSGMDAATLMADAADHGVQFLPGGWFFPDRRADPGLRLSFSNVPEESLVEGAQRLSSAIRALLATGAPAE